MLSGKVWPVHPHPFPDELLSSWLVRIAHANGSKVQTFCHAVFQGKHEIWNRDIDKLAPEWLIEILAEKTGTPYDIAYKTSLKRYENILYEHATKAGIEFWITSLRIYHRKRLGFGLSFCPHCLAEDQAPYFRTSWRVALQTFCPKHQVMMIDRCPKCQSPITFHRLETGINCWDMQIKLSTCSECSFELSRAHPIPIPILDHSTHRIWTDTLSSLNTDSTPDELIERLRVLHQFTKILTSENHKKLLKHLCEMHQMNLNLSNFGERFIEAEGIYQRHQFIYLAWWLLEDWPHRLVACWLEGKIRFNYLLKDFTQPPSWYKRQVKKFDIHYKKREKMRVSKKNS